MKIIIIGSGNLATHLALSLKAAGHTIVQVYSRLFEHAHELAEKVGADYTNNLREINPNADLVIFSVKDDVLEQLISDLPQSNSVLAHTAGSVSMSVFSGRTESYGVFYPLQTFSKNREIDFSSIPLFLEASDNQSAVLLEEIAKSISNNVRFLSSEKRKYLHLSAVFACNFTNHMYDIASNILKEQNIEFDVLKPIILETAYKVMDLSPEIAQTGPAIRFDEKVVQKHMNMLEDENLKEIYLKLSESIHNRTL